jgi:hypothetical protein
MVYSFLNYFFYFFHTSLIIFNVFGWAIPKFRKWNLLTLILTAFSWFILGIWFGWGFCLCTDWHWKVRWNLGYHDMSNSYIHFLILRFTGNNFSEELINYATVTVFFSSLIMSIWLNMRDYKRKNKAELL